MLSGVRNEAVKDVFKVWIYAASSVALGAWTAPWLYNAGKALAEVSQGKRTNGALDALARICRAAEFPQVFQASLVIAAAVLFFPFAEWLRVGRGPGRHGDTPWSIRLPDGAMGSTSGQRLRKNLNAGLHAAAGFFLTGGLFLLIGFALLRTGAFTWRGPADGWVRASVWFFWVPVAFAALQELLFRGIALGIFLRAMSPVAAILLSVLLFAAVGFLNVPPGMNVADPDAAGVGFELLGKLVSRDWLPVAPVLALGSVLAYARWRTASLALPIGLHAGWSVATHLFEQLTTSRAGSVVAGFPRESLREGVLPVLGILVIGALVHFLTLPDETPLE